MGLIPTTPGLEGIEQQAGKKFGYADAPALTPAEMIDVLRPSDAGYQRMLRRSTARWTRHSTGRI
ncbi:hypothetical protein [Actinacidiphila oryziradicis]|uniref:hypothetical protein n=1 Tax=Actinacidiphila oryziradicis TaxID=2571141 RepID=UPI0023F0F977|nr:hypothetical protein [Actinacidiphila oryziradicis]MCW2870317.1 Esterase [Actinacidiphila oryziradicis]